MSSDSSEGVESSVNVIFDVQSVASTIETPMEQWSSLIMAVPEINPKKKAYSEGLFDIDSGEICTKYLPLSDSSIFRHPYYSYPSVKDPGIREALLEPEVKKVYPIDGQELYLATCEEMNQCPVNVFYRSLLGSTINLRYYCVEPKSVRAMAEALKFNPTVKVFDLTENFLSDDAAFHLGVMFKSNTALTKLNLNGCRIGPSGIKRLLSGLQLNRTLKTLNLDRNELGDDGGVYLADALGRGLDIQILSLRYNNLGTKTASAMADSFEIYNKLTHIDLSWNNLFQPLGICNFLNRLQENQYLEELNISWNSLTGARIAASIKNVLLAPNLHIFDISNNKFQGEAIDLIINNLGKAKNLNTFNLSYNPLNTDDSLKVINKMKTNAVNLQNLYMDNINVNDNFVEIINRMRQTESKRNVVVTFGNVVHQAKMEGPDPRDTVLSRAEFLANKPKKHKADIALIFLELSKDHEMMEQGEFASALKAAGATMLDDDLVGEIINVFPGPKTKKSKRVNVKLLVDFVKRKWPEKELPPNPPPKRRSTISGKPEIKGKKK